MFGNVIEMWKNYLKLFHIFRTIKRFGLDKKDPDCEWKL